MYRINGTLFFYAKKVMIMKTEQKKIFKYIGKTGIKNIETAGYAYYNRIKVVVFTPLVYVDKLTFEMAAAGAGVIGNYTHCSFRMNGLGTFKPGIKSNPFSGKKKMISYEEEVRLEMECGEDAINDVVDAMLKSHPYEEPAYEVHDFFRRDKLPSAFLVTFKKKISLNDLILSLNGKINIDVPFTKTGIDKIIFAYMNPDVIAINKEALINCSYIISIENNCINLNKI